MAPEIRGFGPENEGKNEATVLEFFSADRPHWINGFWSREEPENDAFDLENILESGPGNSGFLAGEWGENEATVLEFFLQIGHTEFGLLSITNFL